MRLPDRLPLIGIRQLRGLRVQLLLWIILPLALVLIVLSLMSITQHRRAMTQLVEDRNLGLTLAEANRLAREIDGRTAALAQRVAGESLQPDGASLDMLAAELEQLFPAGLALLAADGSMLGASAEGNRWADIEEARVLAARTAAVGQPQFEGHFGPGEETRVPHLLVGVPTGGGRALVGAIPAESLRLAEASRLAEAGTNGAVLVLDQTGRIVHHDNPSGLHIDDVSVADLPPAPPDAAASATVVSNGHDLLFTYARIDPPGWTLAVAEDVHGIESMGRSGVELLPLALLAVAIFGLMAVTFGVTQVVRPLQELDRRAQRVAWGDFDAVKQPVGGVQEMDELRATLEQMSERIRSYQAGMRDYLSAVTQAQEAERERLAHELHDDTVQALIALKQRAQMARKSLASDPERAGQRLDELSALIDQELIGLRRLIGDLRPIYLEDLGFVPALEMLARQVQQRHGLDVQLDVRGTTVRLAPDLELAAFRIVQQALSNVASHAQAQHAVVIVEFGAEGLTLSVRDDGRGFVPPDQPADLAQEGHFGLMGMRERTMLYGGRLMIDSAPGKGTTVTAWLPCNTCVSSSTGV
jgi:signal transduction histidine kinase